MLRFRCRGVPKKSGGSFLCVGQWPYKTSQNWLDAVFFKLSTVAGRDSARSWPINFRSHLGCASAREVDAPRHQQVLLKFCAVCGRAWTTRGGSIWEPLGIAMGASAPRLGRARARDGAQIVQQNKMHAAIYIYIYIIAGTASAAYVPLVSLPGPAHSR